MVYDCWEPPPPPDEVELPVVVTGGGVEGDVEGVATFWTPGIVVVVDVAPVFACLSLAASSGLGALLTSTI